MNRLTRFSCFFVVAFAVAASCVQGCPSYCHKNASHTPVIVVHGGAGDIPDSRVEGKLRGVKGAVKIGHDILNAGGSALDAVEAAVRFMEDDEYFNAGYGSVLTIEGRIEMSASIMDGSKLGAGAAAIIRDVPHPISLARLVMENTPHVLLVDQGARRFAESQGVEFVPEESLITDFAKEALEDFINSGGIGRIEIGKNPQEREGGTVGAVALDANGHVATATSTGGITGKLPGRVGDTPQLGSGTYADDCMGAVSTTGHGETLLKYNLAHRILNCASYSESLNDPQAATKQMVNAMTERMGQTGGAITVLPDGRVGVHHSSTRMAWASIDSSENKLRYGIEQDQVEIEDL